MSQEYSSSVEEEAMVQIAEAEANLHERLLNEQVQRDHGCSAYRYTLRVHLHRALRQVLLRRRFPNTRKILARLFLG